MRGCLLDQEADFQGAISTRGRRAPSALRQQDVTRGVKAAKGAGLPVAAIKDSQWLGDKIRHGLLSGRGVGAHWSLAFTPRAALALAKLIQHEQTAAL